MEEDIIKSKKEIKRIKTYIDGIDENLEGGIPENHIVLVSGTGGTMKSSVAFNVLYNEALRGEIGIYVTLEQSTPSLLKHMTNMDFDLSKISQCLAMPTRQPDYRKNRPHADFLTNIPLSAKNLKEALRITWGTEKPLDEIPHEQIEKLVCDKYGREEWNEKF